MNSLKLLIVDDSESKCAEIRRELGMHAWRHEVDLTVARSVNGARKYLQLVPFDLLILDVALPNFDGESPVQDAGLTLLREITESDLYKKPRYVLGNTAHKDVIRQAESTFSNCLWRLVYSGVEDGAWVTAISKLLAHIEQAARDASSRKSMTDVCIVSALRQPELEAILDLPWGWTAGLPLDESTFYYEGHATSGNGDVSVVSANALRMGMLPAAILVSKLVQSLRPRVVLMTGICAGIEGKVQLGDIIVSTECWSWESGKYSVKGGERQFEPEIQSYCADDSLVASFMQMQADRSWLDCVRTSWAGRPPATQLSLHLGPLATGAPVVSDTEVVKRIVSINRKTLGIDMEAYAVLGAARAWNHPVPKVTVVKGVCDFANEKKNDEWQHYSAFVSAQAIKQWVEKHSMEFVEQ